MVPLNLTCLHCLQHFFFEYLYNLCKIEYFLIHEEPNSNFHVEYSLNVNLGERWVLTSFQNTRCIFSGETLVKDNVAK